MALPHLLLLLLLLLQVHLMFALLDLTHRRGRMQVGSVPVLEFARVERTTHVSASVATHVDTAPLLAQACVFLALLENVSRRKICR